MASKQKLQEDINFSELDDIQQEAEQNRGKPAAQSLKETKKGYAAVHSSGFKDFLLKAEILRAIVERGFEHPSEVQHECIPQAVLGMDLLCQAKSGMGKTTVFALSVLQQLEPIPNTVQALVLTNTRELAYQNSQEFTRFATHLPNVKCAVFYGGISINTNIEQLANEVPNVVVGTPGKILQLVKGGHLDLSKVKHFIIDECDTVLNSVEMRKDVQEIFKCTPHNKQVMMFSATLNDKTKEIAKKFMYEPLEVLVDNEKLTLHGLQQHFIKLPTSEKSKKLVNLLNKLQYNQVVIFVASIRTANEVMDLLTKKEKFPAISIHSDMKQEDRIARYDEFKSFNKKILVATDVFARGVDIQKVNVVINYDMAESSEQYLHRVGRAARFGTKGLAISFITPDVPEATKSGYKKKPDEEVLSDVQKCFHVHITELPETIDPSTYM